MQFKKECVMKIRPFLLCVLMAGLWGCPSRPSTGEQSPAIADTAASLHHHTPLPEKIPPPSAGRYARIAGIPTPAGYARLPVDSGSFAAFLRQLPLLPGRHEVRRYNGRPKANQEAQFAIIDLDVGTRDLQQCADAVMRLRAEYLFHEKNWPALHFNFVRDGRPRYFVDYAEGDHSHARFRQWLDYVFTYANTASLHDELLPASPVTPRPGDVLIQKGRPYGHAVIITDVARHPETGERLFLLAQSYMPAQDMHVLKNPMDAMLSPWYRHQAGAPIITPEWRFEARDLRRFPGE